MTVYLTSFKAFHERTDESYPADIPGYSVAVYQPSNYPSLPKLNVFDIRSEAGAWIRPRVFANLSDPLDRYHERLLTLYKARAARDDRAWPPAIIDHALPSWLTPVTDVDIALCCWCPYDRAAQRQLREFGSYVCHTAIIETFLRGLGFDVVRDYDRRKMWPVPALGQEELFA